jgi:hypothetical protein
MKKRLLSLSVCLIAICLAAFTQEKSKAKFGNVKPEDFQTKVYAIDSSAAAVIIADIGSTEIVGNNKGTFSLLFKNYRRAHILNKNGYDVANVEIYLYNDGDDEEDIENLKAVTYNLENGKVVETKLEVKSAVFKDKLDKNNFIRKFTFPNIKEGSIIEYEYRVKSDFIRNLQPWSFQGEYPRLWSEYNVAQPEFYNYVTLSQGYHPYAIQDQKRRRDNFVWADVRGTERSERESFSAEVTDYRWVMKDVPALKEESFTSTIRNHISRIEFQLQSVRDPLVYRPVMQTWPQVAKMLLESEYFGLQLSKDNGWMNEMMSEALKNASTPSDKAKNIYEWVRDNFTCTDYSRYSMDQPLRTKAKVRSGTVAEINILLTAMLRKAGFAAHPVILSTRSHGLTYSAYPLLGRFNYSICMMELDGQQVFLDASRPQLGFGKLSTECYNGHARVIDEQCLAIELNPSTLNEKKNSTVFIINNEKGKPIGSMQQVPGYYESYRLRNRIKENGKEQLMKDIQKGFGADITMSKERIDSLEKYEEPVGIFYEFDMNGWEEDIVYLNPMFGEGYKENPFKSAQRFYPVEMPFAMDEIFSLQFEVPEGYAVDELPKQAVVKLNEEEDAMFEYRISQSGNSISLRSRIRVKRAWFDPEEYETLREFFNLIVKKHNEQIVFKKKK